MHCSRLRSSSTLYDIQSDQGRTEVRCCPGQETNLAPSCSNLKSFRSKCTIMKKVPATLLGLLMSPSDSAPGALCPLCYANMSDRRHNKETDRGPFRVNSQEVVRAPSPIFLKFYSKSEISWAKRGTK